MAAPNLRIEPSREEDITRLMEFVIPAFESYHVESLMENISANREAVAKRHLHAWQEHAKNFKIPFAIKCIHTDPATGKETIVANAYWSIYDRPRTEEEYMQPGYLIAASWVSNETNRKEVTNTMAPLVNAKRRWMAWRPHGHLIYMATDPAFQRLGAATKCVQWGIDRCAELGIPAILEASPAGKPVYQRLGFEVVEEMEIEDVDGKIILPFMIRWPEGTKEEDKKPALPGYGK